METGPLGAQRITRRSLIHGALASASFAACDLAAGESELTRLSIQQISSRLRKKSVSPVELTRACLARIEKLNPVLNAFITVTAESALAEARVAEKEIGQGRWKGPLHGVPLALKDLIDTAGVKTTAASALYANRVPDRDAEVVRRLKAAGAISLGKLNLDEFALGSTSENSHFSAVHNPWSLKHSPGGSSSGPAAAVAAGLCFGSIGTDTGGSIREPSSFCGIAGLKPTFGLVSTTGVIPLSRSLDHVGPMCRTVWDTAAVLSAIAGYDASDSNSIRTSIPRYENLLDARTSSLRLGVPRPYFFEDADAEVLAAIETALGVLRKLTASVRDVRIPTIGNPPVLTAEAYAFHEATFRKEPQIFNPRLQRILDIGSKVSAAAYIQGRREIDELRQRMRAVFDDVDLLITPTSPVLPPLLGGGFPVDSPVLRNTRPFNHSGLPAISVCCGFSKTGLPIGLQITGPHLGETRVLALALAFERVSGLPGRFPALS